MNGDMNRFTSAVIALALVVIAANMTYSNIPKTVEKSSASLEEKILPVIGRASITFDGLGVTTGFLVKDGEDLKIARYDAGSMAANENYQPKYLTMIKCSNGQTVYNPLHVDKFN